MDGSKPISNKPLGYLLTFSCYGSWLPGDRKGSVSRSQNGYGTPRLPVSRKDQQANRLNMRTGSFLLQTKAREKLRDAIPRFCQGRKINLSALHVGRTHIHAVLDAVNSPEQMLCWLKAKSTSCLREHGQVSTTQRVWARHGSTIYLWTEEQIRSATEYVRDGQVLRPNRLDPRQARYWLHQFSKKDSIPSSPR
jgi:REP element-mobilizing transposase RayT